MFWYYSDTIMFTLHIIYTYIYNVHSEGEVKCCHLSRHPWLLADGRLVTARLEGPGRVGIWRFEKARLGGSQMTRRDETRWNKMKQDETDGPRTSMDFPMTGENLALKRAVMKARREIDELVPQPFWRALAIKPTVSLRTLPMRSNECHWCRWSSSHSVFCEASEGKGRSRGAARSRFRSTSAEKLLVANAKRRLRRIRPGWGC